jgi:hypothetical protein
MTATGINGFCVCMKRTRFCLSSNHAWLADTIKESEESSDGIHESFESELRLHLKFDMVIQ